MKAKSIFLSPCMLLLGMLASREARAQKPAHRFTIEQASRQAPAADTVGDYSYRIVPGPNDAFGFIVFEKGRRIFQQPPLIVKAVNGSIYFASKEQLERAANMTIERIKKRMPPTLNTEERRKLTTP